MVINGIKRVMARHGESYYYSTDKLFSDNILIEESNFLLDGGIETWVTVHYYNDIDAMMFTLSISSKEMIPPITVYRMVKDVVELHETNKFSDFIAILSELSIQSATSLTQSKDEHRKTVRENVIEYFNEYKELVKSN